MNVLFVASECAPFVKTGGLADVIGSLPKAMTHCGVNVSVILPKYSSIPAQFKERIEHMTAFEVSVGWRRQYCGLQKLDYEGIRYYFIDNEYYFKRDEIYGYYDEGERFIYFNHAVLSSLPYLEETYNIIHCHDWQSGLIPAYLKTTYTYDERYRSLKTLFTIHNLKYQGIYPSTIFHDLLHFPDEHFSGLEWNGAINLLKAALFHADRITTVSPTYANEIKTSYYGEGIESMMHMRSNDLCGIVNGIDYEEYNPETDPYLHHRYYHSQIEKQKNKLALQEELHLPIRMDVPLIALVSRLVEQKGLPLIRHVLHEILEMDIQLVILGTGEEEFEIMFREAMHHYPDKVSAQLFFSEQLARRIYAGSDLFLMPSRFEPCGIGQLIALRYESVPIVRETGGLKDTVIPFNEYNGEGHGFSFTNYNAHDMLHTIRRAISFYHQPNAWNILLNNVYQTDFSWAKSALEYKGLYEQLLEL